MDTIPIRHAAPEDAERLNTGLAALSATLGDAHRVDASVLARACFGETPAAHALLAEDGKDLAGVALFSPVVSTARGGAGVYVSDLWVAEAARGRGVGARLLAAVAGRADSLWGARFLKLAVYHTSPRARAFYDGLGFHAATDETVMTLDGAPFAALRERR